MSELRFDQDSRKKLSVFASTAGGGGVGSVLLRQFPLLRYVRYWKTAFALSLPSITPTVCP